MTEPVHTGGEGAWVLVSRRCSDTPTPSPKATNGADILIHQVEQAVNADDRLDFAKATGPSEITTTRFFAKRGHPQLAENKDPGLGTARSDWIENSDLLYDLVTDVCPLVGSNTTLDLAISRSNTDPHGNVAATVVGDKLGVASQSHKTPHCGLDLLRVEGVPSTGMGTYEGRSISRLPVLRCTRLKDICVLPDEAIGGNHEEMYGCDTKQNTYDRHAHEYLPDDCGNTTLNASRSTFVYDRAQQEGARKQSSGHGPSSSGWETEGSESEYQPVSEIGLNDYGSRDDSVVLVGNYVVVDHGSTHADFCPDHVVHIGDYAGTITEANAPRKDYSTTAASQSYCLLGIPTRETTQVGSLLDLTALRNSMASLRGLREVDDDPWNVFSRETLTRSRLANVLALATLRRNDFGA
ncbi:hypothetical protein JX266_009286 [Neoarthrinium moseri]|nr:hypothetical protein JX266_009286 [Neoarthrinium moseri]